MGLSMKIATKWPLRPVWSESHCVLYGKLRNKDPFLLQMDSSDQTEQMPNQSGQMPRLILVFGVYTGHFVGFDMLRFIFEPSHEIMALFVLHKLILQTRMRSHPVGLDVWFLVRPFVFFHTSCVRTAIALARLRGCAGTPEPSLVAFVRSTIISWAGSFLWCHGIH